MRNALGVLMIALSVTLTWIWLGDLLGWETALELIGVVFGTIGVVALFLGGLFVLNGSKGK